MDQANEQAVAQCAATALEVFNAEPQKTAASPFAAIGAFRKIIEWLRANNINIGVILGNLTAIIEILSSSDSWAVKIERLISLFFPTGRPAVAAPAES